MRSDSHHIVRACAGSLAAVGVPLFSHKFSMVAIETLRIDLREVIAGCSPTSPPRTGGSPKTGAALARAFEQSTRVLQRRVCHFHATLCRVPRGALVRAPVDRMLA